jgi:hypothetical protein
MGTNEVIRGIPSCDAGVRGGTPADQPRHRQRGTGTVDRLPRQVPTELIDLTGISFAALRTCDERLLAASLDRVLRQINRPRANIRESSPPGRID